VKLGLAQQGKVTPLARRYDPLPGGRSKPVTVFQSIHAPIHGGPAAETLRWNTKGTIDDIMQLTFVVEND